MQGFVMGLAAFGGGLGAIYALVFAFEFLGKVVTPGGSAAGVLAMLSVAAMMLLFLKPLGDGIIAARKRR